MSTDMNLIQKMTPANPTPQCSHPPDRSPEAADSAPGDAGLPDSYAKATKMVFDAMLKENFVIWSDDALQRKAGQCENDRDAGKIPLVKEFDEAGIFRRLGLGIFGDGFKRLDAKFERCMAERRWEEGWNRLAEAMALYAVARADMTDTGIISQDELRVAEAYAVSWVRSADLKKDRMSRDRDRDRSKCPSPRGEAGAVEDDLRKMVRELEDKAWDLVHDNLCRK